MKYKLLFLSKLLFILLFFVFGTIRPEKKHIRKNPPPASTLDSLQGKWINIDDTLNEVIINGRYWNEIYNDNTNPINETYRIYFSDTAVNESNFSNVSIDTTALSGAYIITVLQSDNSMDCSYFNGFYQNGTDTTFSINPATKWTMKSLQVFKKVQ